MSKPILIAGAGPVGLILACELGRHGCPVRIVDRNSQPTDKSKALVLWPRTLELLEKAGMARRFVEAGLPLHGMSVFENPSRCLAHIPFDDLRSPFPYVLGIPQNSTERLLVERLAELGVEVERQVEVIQVEQQTDYVEVRLRHPDGRSEVAHTSWLPACDGSHSTVRHQLGIELHGETVAQEFAMIGHQAEPLPDLPSAWHDESGNIHKEFGASEPTLYLIRPDGYVAFRCQPASRQDLDTYLQEMGFPRPVVA